MLQAIRDRSQGLIVGFIVFLISLTFALVGVQGYLTGGSDVVIAEVEGEEVLLSEFQNRIQKLKRRTEELTGEQVDVDFWTTPEVKKRTLDQLIDEKILDIILRERRVTISDDHLVAQVQEIEAFKENGSFSRELYERMVKLNGMSVSSFERGMRQDLIRSRLRAGLLGSEFVTDEESLFMYRLQKQTRDIGYAIIRKNQFSEGVELEKQDVLAHYKKNKEFFRIPERVSLQYIDLSPAQLVGQIEEPDRETLKSFYKNRVDSYRVPEKRKVEHILLSDSESLESFRRGEVVQSILNRLRAGQSAETILSESPTDYVLEGGTTDFFEKGMMTPQFEEVVFAMELDEVSAPFTSQFGVHIAKLVGIQADYTPDLGAIYEEVADSFKESEADDLFLEVADQMSEISYEDPTNLDTTANSLGLELKEIGPLDRPELVENFGVGFANKVFEPDVLIEGLNSELVELPDGRLIVARVKLHMPSEIPPFEKIMPVVESSWRSGKERELAKMLGEELLEGMRNGLSVDQLAGNSDLNWEVLQGVNITNTSIEPEILKKSFEANVPNNNPVYFGQELPDGDYAVVRIANVSIPSADTITLGEAALAEEEILRAQAAAAWDDFSRSQRQRFNIEIFEDRL